jgi:hypothetical protein
MRAKEHKIGCKEWINGPKEDIKYAKEHKNDSKEAENHVKEHKNGCKERINGRKEGIKYAKEHKNGRKESMFSSKECDNTL